MPFNDIMNLNNLSKLSFVSISNIQNKANCSITIDLMQRQFGVILVNIIRRRAKKDLRPLPLWKKLPRGGRVALRPLMPRWSQASPQIKKGTGMWSQKKEKKRKKKKKGEKGGGPCPKSAGDHRHA